MLSVLTRIEPYMLLADQLVNFCHVAKVLLGLLTVLTHSHLYPHKALLAFLRIRAKGLRWGFFFLVPKGFAAGSAHGCHCRYLIQVCFCSQLPVF